MCTIFKHASTAPDLLLKVGCYLLDLRGCLTLSLPLRRDLAMAHYSLLRLEDPAKCVGPVCSEDMHVLCAICVLRLGNVLNGEEDYVCAGE